MRLIFELVMLGGLIYFAFLLVVFRWDVTGLQNKIAILRGNNETERKMRQARVADLNAALDKAMAKAAAELREAAKQNLQVAKSLLSSNNLLAESEMKYRTLYESFRMPLNKMALEVFLAKLQTSSRDRLPAGVDLLADEVGNVLYTPRSTETPRRVFVYLCRKGTGEGISRRELHSDPARPMILHQRVTFVLDEWLSIGEVTTKLHRAAADVLKGDALV